MRFVLISFNWSKCLLSPPPSPSPPGHALSCAEAAGRGRAGVGGATTLLSGALPHAYCYAWHTPRCGRAQRQGQRPRHGSRAEQSRAEQAGTSVAFLGVFTRQHPTPGARSYATTARLTLLINKDHHRHHMHPMQWEPTDGNRGARLWQKSVQRGREDGSCTQTKIPKSPL